jgi:hypothetical protein
VISVYLFVVTGSIREAATLAAVTIFAWWGFCDYYMLPRFLWWTSWMDLFAFVPVSVLGLLTIVALRKWLVSRALSRFAQLPHLPGPDQRLDVQTWGEMLRELEQRPGVGPAKRYLRWQRCRLVVLNPVAKIDSAAIFRAWWPHPVSMVRTWLLSGWPLLLWAVLILAPLHTNVMERIATTFSSHPRRIFDVLVEAKGANGKIVRESLRLQAGNGGLARSDTAFLARGTVTVRATDFPRVYRHVEAFCGGSSPACLISEDSSSNSELDLNVPIRGGTASFDFIQTTPEPVLNLRLWLTRRDGGRLNTVTIESRAVFQ